MIFTHDVLRERLLANAGVIAPVQMPSLQELQASEWSSVFEGCMRRRLIMGAFRYGLLHAPGKPAWDRVREIRRRAMKYVETGDLDLLVDVANMALLEFEEGTHPNRHLGGAADHAYHAVAR